MNELVKKLASLLETIYKYDRGYEEYPWKVVRLELEEFYQDAVKFLEENK